MGWREQHSKCPECGETDFEECIACMEECRESRDLKRSRVIPSAATPKFNPWRSFWAAFKEIVYE